MQKFLTVIAVLFILAIGTVIPPTIPPVAADISKAPIYLATQGFGSYTSWDWKEKESSQALLQEFAKSPAWGEIYINKQASHLQINFGDTTHTFTGHVNETKMFDALMDFAKNKGVAHFVAEEGTIFYKTLSENAKFLTKVDIAKKTWSVFKAKKDTSASKQ